MIKAIDIKVIKNNNDVPNSAKECVESNFNSIIKSVSKNKENTYNSKANNRENYKDKYSNLHSDNIGAFNNTTQKKYTKNLKSEKKEKENIIKSTNDYKDNKMLDNQEYASKNCNEVIEKDNEEVKEKLDTLVSLLSQYNENDMSKISIEYIASSDDNLIEFIGVLLQNLDNILNNVELEGVVLSPEILTEGVNAISELLQAKGLDGNGVANLLADLKNMVQEANFNSEEFKDLFFEMTEEIVTLLDSNVEKTAETDQIISKSTNIVNTNNEEKINNIQEKVEAIEEGISDNSNDDNLEDNSNEASTAFTKEEKILNSILNNNTDNTIVNRFAVFTNDYSIASNISSSSSIEVNSGTAVQDIVKAIRFMTSEGIDELMVKVNPRGLGELIISILKEGDTMKAEIKASSKETYNLILQNADDIKKYLGEQNIKVQNVDISLTKDATDNELFFGEPNGRNDNRKSNNKNNLNAEIIEEIDNDLSEELINNINMLV